MHLTTLQHPHLRASGIPNNPALYLVIIYHHLPWYSQNDVLPFTTLVSFRMETKCTLHYW